MLLLAAIWAGFYSCKKSISGISNNQVVETPFSLYFSDSSGGLYSSNDGKNIRQTLFKADGYPSKAICVAGDNILWAKSSLLISTNNGTNFNHSFDSLGSYPGFACNGFPIDLNQSMMIEIAAWNRVYIVSDSVDELSPNYLGIRFSLYQGTQGLWYTDGRPDTMGGFGNYGPEPFTVTITSFTQLTNGILCGYDARHNRNCYLTSTNVLWRECTANPDAATNPGLAGIGNNFNKSGVPLPHCDANATPVDTAARYSYGHFNNRLIAIDNKNCNKNGAYYSDDTGRNWTQYAGLPGVPLLCVASPFEEVSLIGTAGAGLYMLNNNTGAWQVNNNGLGTNLIVHNIAFKENIYKDGSIQKYVFLATNNGIYMSTDMGTNWTQTIPGNFVTIY